jgi:hypothetical protein
MIKTIWDLLHPIVVYDCISFFSTSMERVRVMVFSATFSNISAISQLSVLLVEDTVVPAKTTDLPQVTDKQNHRPTASH